MKKISLLILCCVLFFQLLSQQKNLVFSSADYPTEWKKIEELENQGLPKSALEAVNELMKKVRSENNPAQLVKCILKREAFLLQTTDSGTVMTINHLRREVNTAVSPTKEILLSALAGVLQQYYQERMWELANRSVIENENENSVETWSAKKLINTTNEYYLASTSNADYLQSIEIRYFLPILIEGNAESDKLRPTLYDLLAHRAADYFINDQSNLTQPADAFVMRNPIFFNIPLLLNGVAIPTDSSSYKWQALRIFESLEKFHSGDKDGSALLDVVLKRINYVNQHLVHKEKDKLYLKALENAEKKFANNPMSADFLYHRAAYYFNKGALYDAENPRDERKMFFRRALELCDLCSLKYPKSSGNLKCIYLVGKIKKPELSLQCEQVNIPGKPILVKVNYRNTEKFHVKVLKYSRELEDEMNKLKGEEAERSKLNLLNAQKEIYSSAFETKPTDDFRNHSTEIMVEKGFNVGRYLLVISDSTNFDSGQTQYAPFRVSSLGCVTRGSAKGNEVLVMDRENGKPISGVNITARMEQYNDRTSQYDNVEKARYRTDKNGMATVSLERSNGYTLVLHKGKDTLEIDRYFYQVDDESASKSYERTIFFVDRAIYRPGQRIFFKGLALQYDRNSIPQVVKDKTVKVVFRDANYTIVDSLALKSNEFGTFSGSFTAPASGLSGQMSIGSSIGSTEKYFRVEEYKRPKFEANFKPVQGSYQLNDEIVVTGIATAFAGNSIDGAKVRYRVRREVNYPYWGYWCWWRPIPSSAALEIVNSETTTNSKGEFTIKFVATPDEQSETDNKPQFNYTITADVIDISGETHSVSSIVSVSEILVNIDIELPELCSSKALKKIKIKSTNLAGEKEPTMGFVRIAKLAEPRVQYHERKWTAPDMPIIPESIFRKNFPSLAYAAEDKVQNRKVEKEFYSGLYDNSATEEYNLSKVNWEAGTYMIVVSSTDKNKMGIEIKKYFRVYDAEKKSIPYQQEVFSVSDKKSYEPGQTAIILLGNKTEKLNVLFELEDKSGKIVSRKWLSIQNMQTQNLNITEADRGNIFYHLTYIRKNRFYHFTGIIDVPWSNKELNIEYMTFRDKTLPGAKEEWRVRISGPKRDLAVAEMVATMYDASLDRFAPNIWELPEYPVSYAQRQFNADQDFDSGASMPIFEENNAGSDVEGVPYRQLNIGLPGYFYGNYFRDGRPAVKYDAVAMPMGQNAEGLATSKSQSRKMDSASIQKVEELKKLQNEIVNPRTNLNETVFFKPHLMTDAGGNIYITFIMNEALTRWKFLGMAHTGDLKVLLTQKEIVTRKTLMVQPNPPRFLREGDEITFTSKVVNLSDAPMSGNALLKITDALSGQVLDFVISDKQVVYNVEAGQSTLLNWKLRIPVEASNALTWTVSATAGEYSDAESNSLPIVSNRMLVTETFPLPVRAGQKRSFRFDGLVAASSSGTIQTKNLTLEYTSNPAWYAVQALPYLMENPMECTEHIFSRYYANALSESILNAHPNIKKVFESWKADSADGKGPESNLMKNQELKSALLKETPWVLQSLSETQQKQNIALLFDLSRIAGELHSTIDKLAERQMQDGSFSWFPGGIGNWYMTQYLLEGFGHLKKLQVKTEENPKIELICNKALRYIDSKLLEHYSVLNLSVAKGNSKWEDNHLDPMVVHYLYTRSFFPEIEKSDALKTAENYYAGQAKQFWTSTGIYEQGLLTLALHRMGDTETPGKVILSLKERAIHNEETGMYWKRDNGYYWYQLPIETQSLMIEVFSDVAGDDNAVDDLRTWLLKNKQTNHWESTKATSSAVYALLMADNNWLGETKNVRISFSGKPFEIAEIKKEAGTGYFKTNLLLPRETNNINGNVAQFSKVEVENPNNVPAWGAMYWQYLEQLDKIKTFRDTPLKLKKKFFLVESSNRGPLLKAIEPGTRLQPGDQIKVRIELQVDRDMEYIHMKDMRASGLEPLNVLSTYNWQGGLGYYESTGDLATNFYFDYVPKGNYVFEYPLRVNLRGEFSNGTTSIQCMYAPEFSSHSEGIKIIVD